MYPVLIMEREMITNVMKWTKVVVFTKPICAITVSNVGVCLSVYLYLSEGLLHVVCLLADNTPAIDGKSMEAFIIHAS